MEYINKCFNLDGGFGGMPNAESHAAYTFCSIGAINLLGYISEFNFQWTLWFLAKRQTPQGGFNGRPEKLPDVCYSWWVLASIKTITKEVIVDESKLIQYILNCQNSDGGFTDRPGNPSDIFHTFFAIAALSLLDHQSYSLLEIDPVYSIPKKFI